MVTKEQEDCDLDDPSMKSIRSLVDFMNWQDFMHTVRFNEMNQYHNCIQGGKYGWKEGAV